MMEAIYYGFDIFQIRIQNFSCWEENHTKRRKSIAMTTITEVSGCVLI